MTQAIFDFVTLEYVNQTAGICKVAVGASSDLQTLVASQNRELHAVAESVVAFPFQGMLDHGEDTGRLYDHFDDFFAARAKQQAELNSLNCSPVEIANVMNHTRRILVLKNPQCTPGRRPAHPVAKNST